MRLEQSFEVPVPVAQAWEVLLDVERIAPCMPGATLTGFDGETFTGVVKVKLGPVSLAYRGNGRFVEKDEAGRRVALVASGQDSRGAGGAAARVSAVLHETRDGQATLVKVVTDLDIAGRAAQFGRGMINDVSGKLIKQFADCLAETIAATSVASASAGSAVAGSAGAAAAAGTGSATSAAPAPAPPVPAASTAVETPAPVVPPAPVEVLAPPPAPAQPAPQAEAPAEPAPVETPSSAESEYHPLALQEPEVPVQPITPMPPTPAPPPVVPQPESVYAYEPPPPPVVPAVEATAPPAPTPAPQPRPTPKENEPIDLLAITGAKGMLRRYAPIIAIVIVIIVVLIIVAVVS
jgi:carbon monoxide dehydrogenase subunit G